MRFVETIVRLFIEIKKTIYPGDVQKMLWRFKNPIAWPGEQGSGQRVQFVVADSISDGAKDLLRKEDVGYFERGGSLFLHAADIYLYIEHPQSKPMARPLRSLFSKRSAQVLHILLLPGSFGTWFSVKSLAEQARVSPATASEVLAELERLGWVESKGRGPAKLRWLNKPKELLDAWVKQLAAIKPPAQRRYYVPTEGNIPLLEHIAGIFKGHGVEYAVS